MGIGSDLRNIKIHGLATKAELREFLAKMHGRSPQEVLGLVAESGLIRATIQSVILCIVLMAAFSAGPYMWAKAFPPDKSMTAKPMATPAKEQKTQPTSDSQSAATGAAPADDKSAASSTNVDKAAKAMGIGDAKVADPKKNPLDKDLDKLLDDIK